MINEKRWREIVGASLGRVIEVNEGRETRVGIVVDVKLRDDGSVRFVCQNMLKFPTGRENLAAYCEDDSDVLIPDVACDEEHSTEGSIVIAVGETCCITIYPEGATSRLDDLVGEPDTEEIEIDPSSTPWGC